MKEVSRIIKFTALLMPLLFAILLASCDQPSNGGSQQDNSYTVVYDKNAGDAAGTMADSVFTIGSLQKLQTNTFSRTIPAGSPFGYAFAGWALSADGSPEYADGEVCDFSASAGTTVTLYAVWKEYPVIYPIPQGNISQQSNNYAQVRVPNNNNTAFAHFAIFYRIYVSDQLLADTGYGKASQYSTINTYLAQDYNSVAPYIDSTTLVNQNWDYNFRNRPAYLDSGTGYCYLALEGANIDNVLSSSVLGTTITFSFPSNPSQNERPSMTIGSQSPYFLRRSDNNSLNTPKPGYDFINYDDLWNPQYINPQFSADVVNSGNMVGGNRYTYAAMFIVAVGIDTSTYSNIYSTPSLVGVFLLPDPQ